MATERGIAISRTVFYAGLGVILLTGCSAEYGESIGPVRPLLSLANGETQLSLTDPYQRGKACLFLGQYGLAVSAFEEAVKKSPHSIGALNALAATYDRLQRFDLADRYYREALALEPNSAQTLNNVGYSYFLRGDSHNALAYLRKADEAAGGDKTILGNLVLVQRSTATATAQASGKPGESPFAAGSGAETPRPGMRIERATSRMQDLITIPVADDRDSVKRTAQITADLDTDAPESSLATHPLGETQPSASTRKPSIPGRADAASAAAPGQADRTEAETAAVPLGPEGRAPQTVGDRRSFVAPVPLWRQFAMKVERIAGGTVRARSQAATQGQHRVAGNRQGPATEAAATPVDSASLLSRARAEFDAAVEAVLVALHGKPAPAPKFGHPEAPAPHAGSVLAAFEEEAAAQPKMPVFGHIFQDTVVEVSNGTGRSGMAARMRDFLLTKNIPVGRLTDSRGSPQSRTILSYREGFEGQAERLAGMMPQPVELQLADQQAADLRLLLGMDLLGFDRALLLVSSPLADGSAI